MIRTLVASDTFTRADEDPLASPWGVYTGGNSLRLVSGAVLAAIAPTAVWNLQTHNAALSANQYVQAVAAQPDTNTQLGLLLRFPAPGATVTGYLLTGGFSTAPTIYRVDNVSTYVSLHVCTGLITTADVVSFEAAGTHLIAYLNGAEIGRATDATYGSGVAGLGIYIGPTGAGSWDTFVSGNLTTGPDGGDGWRGMWRGLQRGAA